MSMASVGSTLSLFLSSSWTGFLTEYTTQQGLHPFNAQHPFDALQKLCLLFSQLPSTPKLCNTLQYSEPGKKELVSLAACAQLGKPGALSLFPAGKSPDKFSVQLYGRGGTDKVKLFLSLSNVSHRRVFLQ